VLENHLMRNPYNIFLWEEHSSKTELLFPFSAMLRTHRLYAFKTHYVHFVYKLKLNGILILGGGNLHERTTELQEAILRINVTKKDVHLWPFSTKKW
jgi:hypothetical protein